MKSFRRTTIPVSFQSGNRSDKVEDANGVFPVVYMTAGNGTAGCSRLSRSFLRLQLVD